MKKPHGIILAGGQARRMGGGDKGRLKLGAKSLLERVLSRLELQVSSIALNANGNAERFSDLGLAVVADSINGYTGPLAGVLAGLDWAQSNGDNLIVTVAVDTPFFPLDLVSQLMKVGNGMTAPLVLSATRDSSGNIWRHPTFGLWPVSLRTTYGIVLKRDCARLLIGQKSIKREKLCLRQCLLIRSLILILQKTLI